MDRGVSWQGCRFFSSIIWASLIYCCQESPRKRVGMSDDGPGRLPELKAIQQTRRLLANARERTRVHTISAAFEALRKQVRLGSSQFSLSSTEVTTWYFSQWSKAKPYSLIFNIHTENTETAVYKVRHIHTVQVTISQNHIQRVFGNNKCIHYGLKVQLLTLCCCLLHFHCTKVSILFLSCSEKVDSASSHLGWFDLTSGGASGENSHQVHQIRNDHLKSTLFAHSQTIPASHKLQTLNFVLSLHWCWIFHICILMHLIISKFPHL